MKTFLGPPFTFAWPLGTAVWEGLLFLSRYIWQMVFELDRTEIARTDSSLLIGDIEANTIRASPSYVSHKGRAELQWRPEIYSLYGRCQNSEDPFQGVLAGPYPAHCLPLSPQLLAAIHFWSKIQSGPRSVEHTDLSTREIALQEILNHWKKPFVGN